MTGDHIIRATIPGVRGFAAVTTNLVEEARKRHDCYPVAAAALGRTITASLLLAHNLKTEESITIRIAGNGPAGEIVADAQPGIARGYIHNPHVDLPLKGVKLDVGKAVGSGEIYVTRFTGLKHPFTGSAQLVSGEIAEDVTNYLMVSEQTPSSVALGVLVDTDLQVIAAGGFMIQVLPGAADEVLSKIENTLATLPTVTELIKTGCNAADLLEKVFAGFEVTTYPPEPILFKCRCTREKVEKMLISLGEKELSEMVVDGQAEVCCHFCGDKYQFTRQELENLLQDVKH